VTIHVALVSAYPTEAKARAVIDVPDGAPYHGTWTMPLPYGGRVHVFGDADPERLEAAGWTREGA
jgi:hypothetical protein